MTDIEIEAAYLKKTFDRTTLEKVLAYYKENNLMPRVVKMIEEALRVRVK